MKFVRGKWYNVCNMNSRQTISIFFGLVLAGSQAFAAPSQCPEHFAAGQAPNIVNLKMAAAYRELCSVGFAVGHSGLTRTGLWSAERITRERVRAQKGLERENVFHADDRLPPRDRSEIKDYARSGFDRGHLTPSASAWSMEVQAQTFALSNMIPQHPDNNRKLHAHIEGAVREMGARLGEIYVITGPIYQGEKIGFLNNRVAIPTHIFKLVYDPRSQKAGAYLETNDASPDYKEVSLQEIEQLTGMRLLPGVRVAGQLKLPPPKTMEHNNRAEARHASNSGLLKEIGRVLSSR